MTTINPGDLVPASKINQWCPPGLMAPYAGATPPAGWLLCDGASYLRSDYPDLFAAIGAAFGAADGTHFNVPDMRSRVPLGAGTNNALAGNEGAAEASRPAGGKHRHTVTDPTHSHGSPYTRAGAGSNTVTAQIETANRTFTGSHDPDSGAWTNAAATGVSVGNAAHPLDGPAYAVLTYMIRAKDV